MNGALADMGLTTDPFTGSQYAFGNGNPVTNIENDGHKACAGTASSPVSDCSVQGGPQMAPPGMAVLGQGSVTGDPGRIASDLRATSNWWNNRVKGTTSSCNGNNRSTPCTSGLLFQCTPGISVWEPGCTPGTLTDQMQFVRHLCTDPKLSCDQATWQDYLSAVIASGKASGLLAPNISEDEYFAAMAGRQAEAEANGLSTVLGDLERACQSFTPGTRVLLASGKTKPISKLKPGDKVLATSTKTGKTQAETVTAVEVRHDHDLYNLRVKTAHGIQVIHTTSDHLFWDTYLNYWVPASKLKKGEHLKTPNGTVATADGGTTPRVHDGWMWDLTVPGNGDHDFYVSVVGSAILAHNASEPDACRLTLGPAYPSDGIAASGRNITPDQQAFINKSGDKNGCSTCGAMSSGWSDGHWTADHNPAYAIAPNGPWTLYPQCMVCMRSQSGIVRAIMGGWYSFPPCCLASYEKGCRHAARAAIRRF